MKRSILLSLVLSLCLGLIAAGAAAQKSGQKPPKLTAVPLKVTIQNTDSSGQPTRIRSDCHTAANPDCPYISGVDGVQASFDNEGNLVATIQPVRKRVVRSVYFDYEDAEPLSAEQLINPPPDAHALPLSGYQGNVHIVTWWNAFGAYFEPLQNMSVGQVECVGMAITFDADGVNWRNNYRYANNFPDSYRSSYAVVTRIDASTWEIEPKPSSCNGNGANPGVAEVNDRAGKGLGTLTTNGLYYVPVKLTLTKK